MNIKLIAHTQLSREFVSTLQNEFEGATDGQMVALSAIRTCYSHNKPSEIVKLEGEKYFGSAAKDGEGGTDADRLLRHIIKSGHTSTLEHINFTFTVEGVSRSLLAQLTRHRHFSFSVQSQRYVKLESESKSGGFDYITPPTVTEDKTADMYDFVYGTPIANRPSTDIYKEAMEMAQIAYNKLRESGVKAEDARYILPNAATCNLVLTGNLRSILEFYSKRASKQAQHEIRELAEHMKSAVIEVEPWTASFFQVK